MFRRLWSGGAATELSPLEKKIQEISALPDREIVLESLWRQGFVYGMRMERLRVYTKDLEAYDARFIPDYQWLKGYELYLLNLSYGHVAIRMDEVNQKFTPLYTSYDTNNCKSYHPGDKTVRPQPVLELDPTEEECQAEFAIYKANNRPVTTLSSTEYAGFIRSFVESIEKNQRSIAALEAEGKKLWKGIGKKEKIMHELCESLAVKLQTLPNTCPDLVQTAPAISVNGGMVALEARVTHLNSEQRLVSMIENNMMTVLLYGVE